MKPIPPQNCRHVSVTRLASRPTFSFSMLHTMSRVKCYVMSCDVMSCHLHIMVMSSSATMLSAVTYTAARTISTSV